MQRLAVFAKVLRTGHQSAHLFQDCRCSPADLGPSPTETVDGRCSKSRNDGCESRIVVESTAFLYI